MLPAYDMAKMVYDRLIEETRRLQVEVVMQNMVSASFGPDALPLKGKLQLSLAMQRTEEWAKERITDANQKVEKNIALIERFEKAFEEHHFEPEAFGSFLATLWGDTDGQ
jgi:hypothetical protein